MKTRFTLVWINKLSLLIVVITYFLGKKPLPEGGWGKMTMGAKCVIFYSKREI